MKYIVYYGEIERNAPSYRQSSIEERNQIINKYTDGDAICDIDLKEAARCDSLQEARDYIYDHPIYAYMYGASDYLMIPFYDVRVEDEDGYPVDDWDANDLFTFGEAAE